MLWIGLLNFSFNLLICFFSLIFCTVSTTSARYHLLFFVRPFVSESLLPVMHPFTGVANNHWNQSQTKTMFVQRNLAWHNKSQPFLNLFCRLATSHNSGLWSSCYLSSLAPTEATISFCSCLIVSSFLPNVALLFYSPSVIRRDITQLCSVSPGKKSRDSVAEWSTLSLMLLSLSETAEDFTRWIGIL